MSNLKQDNRSKKTGTLNRVSKKVKGMSRTVKAEIKTLINEGLKKGEKTLAYLEKELRKLQTSQTKKQASMRNKLRTAVSKKLSTAPKKKRPST